MISGWGAAVELTKRGHEVIATARRPEVLEELDVAQKLALDVDSDDSVRDAVAAAGRVDVLVNNAGFGVIGPVELLPIDEGKRMFETNFFGALRMIQAVMPQMRERGAARSSTSPRLPAGCRRRSTGCTRARSSRSRG